MRECGDAVAEARRAAELLMIQNPAHPYPYPPAAHKAHRAVGGQPGSRSNAH